MIPGGWSYQTVRQPKEAALPRVATRVTVMDSVGLSTLDYLESEQQAAFVGQVVPVVLLFLLVP